MNLSDAEARMVREALVSATRHIAYVRCDTTLWDRSEKQPKRIGRCKTPADGWAYDNDAVCLEHSKCNRPIICPLTQGDAIGRDSFNASTAALAMLDAKAGEFKGSTPCDCRYGCCYHKDGPKGAGWYQTSDCPIHGKPSQGEGDK